MSLGGGGTGRSTCGGGVGVRGSNREEVDFGYSLEDGLLSLCDILSSRPVLAEPGDERPALGGGVGERGSKRDGAVLG